jgi:hypothetical protein
MASTFADGGQVYGGSTAPMTADFPMLTIPHA